tara:strand:- start:970 stop:1152 length:183 start_codon:yes stop_codon:yes gene_type:complete
MSYEWITHEAFVAAVEEASGADLSIPGMWEVVSEEFNNEAISLVEEAPERFGLTAPKEDE